MRTLNFILSILITSSLVGQTNKSISVPTYINYKDQIDTSLWYVSKLELAKQIKIENLQLSADSFHFRLWTDIQAVDIWTNDHVKYFGTITNYAQRYDSKLL